MNNQKENSNVPYLTKTNVLEFLNISFDKHYIYDNKKSEENGLSRKEVMKALVEKFIDKNPEIGTFYNN